jgi:hypothetical protein
MMFFNNHVLLAIDVPDAPSVATSSISGSILDILINPVVNPDADTIPKALNSLWDIAMNGNMYRVISAFLYIIEVMMLVTALIGPVPLALSLFPVGTRPIMTWMTSFLSLGFCKICFSLFSGLSSLAMVYSGPENVDMLVAAIVLGLLAPALSFAVASGAGISALSTISSSGQGIGINTGVSTYYPGTGRSGDDSSNNRRNHPGENS